MRTKRNNRQRDEAIFDLTPMIDVTFQLLIFFILCTRFVSDEKNHKVELPKDDGGYNDFSIPKEQITIYCAWDETSNGNSYVVAMDARWRRHVEGSFAKLHEFVIYPEDSNAEVRVKQTRYHEVFWNLVTAIEDYAQDSGATIDQLEIAFAHDPAVGATSGTVPWMFVSTALDAAVQVNVNRKNAGLKPLGVTFKFCDALGVYR